MPNTGCFIQQITRRDAGTLFDEGMDKNRATIPIVNKKAACSRKRAAQKNSFSFLIYIAAHGSPHVRRQLGHAAA